MINVLIFRSELILFSIWNYICSWFTPFWITVYLLLSIVPVWLVIYNCRSLVGTPELNEKYYSFARFDYKNWSYWKFPLYSIVFLSPIRIFIAVAIKIIYIIIAQLVLIGHKSGQPLAKWRFTIMKFCIHYLGRLHILMCGCYSLQKVKPKMDYKKYLGPSWKE